MRDLAPGTTYHYRLVVNTPAGAVYSPDATFTTKPYTGGSGLIVETHQPLGKTRTAAAFAATVQGTGRYWFEWGETQAFGRTTPPREIPAGDWSPRSVKELVTGLEPGRQYHYRVVAENAFGRVVARGGAGLLTYTGPTSGEPTPDPDPDPDPTPSPDPGPEPTPAPTGPPDPLGSSLPLGAGLAPSFSPIPARGAAPPVPRSFPKPRVSVSRNRIVVAVSERTRIVIHRRQGTRWVRVAGATTSRTYRRTVKPGVTASRRARSSVRCGSHLAQIRNEHA